MAIGEFDPHNLEDYLADSISNITHNVAEWMKDYTHGVTDEKGKDYPTMMSISQEADLDIILQGAKVIDLLRQAQREISILHDIVSGMDD